MILPFPEFVRAYADGSIANDVSWRAYDFPASFDEGHAAAGAQALGYPTKGDVSIAYGQVAADYGLAHATQAKYMLGLWYIWSRVCQGRRFKGLIAKEYDND